MKFASFFITLFAMPASLPVICAQTVAFQLTGTVANSVDIFTAGKTFTYTFTMDLGASATVVSSQISRYATISSVNFNYDNGVFVSSLALGSSPIEARVINSPGGDSFYLHTNVPVGTKTL